MLPLIFHGHRILIYALVLLIEALMLGARAGISFTSSGQIIIEQAE